MPAVFAWVVAKSLMGRGNEKPDIRPDVCRQPLCRCTFLAPVGRPRGPAAVIPFDEEEKRMPYFRPTSPLTRSLPSRL